MPAIDERSCVRLPKDWSRRVRSRAIHAISLARFSLTADRGHAASSWNARIYLQEENDRLHQEIALLKEEIRIKDSRMERISPQRRPHYRPTERLAILELRAARGWSLAQTARHMLVTPLIVIHWNRRLDDEEPDALVQIREPVNRFPEFVGYLVRRLKALCPSVGTRPVARVLARAGLHLSATTVRRMLHPAPKPTPKALDQSGLRVVTAKRPNHVWHLDLTTVATSSCLWTAWAPFAFPQCWPFCWWVVVVVDRYSRRVMGAAVFIEGADDGGGGPVSRSRLPGAPLAARPPHHRPRHAVHRERLRDLVSPARRPPPIRGHREVRQPRRRRAVHPVDEGRMRPGDPGAVPTG